MVPPGSSRIAGGIREITLGLLICQRFVRGCRLCQPIVLPSIPTFSSAGQMIFLSKGSLPNNDGSVRSEGWTSKRHRNFCATRTHGSSSMYTRERSPRRSARPTIESRRWSLKRERRDFQHPLQHPRGGKMGNKKGTDRSSTLVSTPRPTQPKIMTLSSWATGPERRLPHGHSLVKDSALL